MAVLLALSVCLADSVWLVGSGWLSSSGCLTFSVCLAGWLCLAHSVWLAGSGCLSVWLFGWLMLACWPAGWQTFTAITFSSFAFTVLIVLFWVLHRCRRVTIILACFLGVVTIICLPLICLFSNKFRKKRKISKRRAESILAIVDNAS